MFPTVRSKINIQSDFKVNLRYFAFPRNGVLCLVTLFQQHCLWLLAHQRKIVLTAGSCWGFEQLLWSVLHWRWGKLCCCYSRCSGASRSPWHLASITVVPNPPLELASAGPGTSLSSTSLLQHILYVCLGVHMYIQPQTKWRDHSKLIFIFWNYYL